MRSFYLIGIGPGGPEYLTLQAVAALRRVDVFFVLEKEGRGKEALADARRHILEAHCEPGRYRVVTAASPARAPDRSAEGGPGYAEGVEAWYDDKAALIAGLIITHLAEGQTGALLVWGDPSLYDGNLAIFRRIRATILPDLALEVIPGITSLQLLAARHQITLADMGDEVLITTARRLREGAAAGHGSVAVMLDSNAAFANAAPADSDIYWGANLGSEREILRAGRVGEVGGQIADTIAREKQRHGWIFDIYLLRRPR
jgi:precorrin-6A synthase